MLAADTRPRMFGERRCGIRNAGLQALREPAREAEMDLRRASTAEARPWVQGGRTRARKIADLRRNRTEARANFKKRSPWRAGQRS